MLTAPKIQLPDDYKDDPGLTAFSDQINKAFQHQTDLNNALVTEAYQSRDTISNLSGSYSQTTQAGMWQQFTAAHPEAADESVIAQMTDQMKLLNPDVPLDKQWELALSMSGNAKKPTAGPPGESVEDKVQRGRAARATGAASGRTGRRTTGRVETPETVTAGMTFEDTYRIESKNGMLPSQKT
jgi:hypothetical protein